ncbi:hypothetical protein V1509DRAFT_632406 [Lipomyces kononenkoae]
MSYIIRFLVVVLAIACWVSAHRYVCETELCLFKGHPKSNPKEIVFWLEEKSNQFPIPFYKMSDLSFSDFKDIQVALKNTTLAPALIYLYHNREAETENVAFVNYDKTAYHFSGSEKLDRLKFRSVLGKKMEVDFGSCVKPEESWEWPVKSTTADFAGFVIRSDIDITF